MVKILIKIKMKLKTLKDLDYWKNYCNGLMEEETVRRDEIKAEAIKHIKAGRKGVYLGATIEDYIMWANNITEEDLK